MVTPEYNHSFPGPLKSALDGLGAQLHAKPVGLISYGGISGGLRAVEQLRVVLAELHAVTVRNTISFHHAWGQFDDAGEPLDQLATEGATKALLDQLVWWADALRTARATRPYAA